MQNSLPIHVTHDRDFYQAPCTKRVTRVVLVPANDAGLRFVCVPSCTFSILFNLARKFRDDASVAQYAMINVLNSALHDFALARSNGQAD